MSKYECVVCDETFDEQKECVLHEWAHTKEQTKAALRRLNPFN